MEEEWVSGNVKLKLFGEPVEMEMNVPANGVKLRRMLPIFQAMTSSFVEIGESAIAARGEEISCQKGCGACCRQAVPLSEMEAYHIRDLVEALPEPRRAEVKKKFADGFEHFFENGWFERMNEYGKMSYEKRVETVMEYFYEGIACPFLEEESCSIHLSRPLICREYLVTSPPENCASPSATTVKMLKLPVKVSESVRQFNRTEHFVPMIAALAFAAKFPEDDTEKPGTEWMGEFFTHLAGQESSPQAN